MTTPVPRRQAALARSTCIDGPEAIDFGTRATLGTSHRPDTVSPQAELRACLIRQGVLL
ncbi:hypothetical protein [Streptomyces sp. OE57]|uniref:hypothetical protein n=1 Tax=Streptomyces lacaronensis TaxID=3379885 RepID=UPI0039B756B5